MINIDRVSTLAEEADLRLGQAKQLLNEIDNDFFMWTNHDAKSLLDKFERNQLLFELAQGLVSGAYEKVSSIIDTLYPEDKTACGNCSSQQATA